MLSTNIYNVSYENVSNLTTLVNFVSDYDYINDSPSSKFLSAPNTANEIWKQNWILELSGFVSINNMKENKVTKVLTKMDLFYLPAMISLGLVGNFMICVMSRCSQIAVMSVTPFLVSLAITDFLYLFGQLMKWLYIYHNIDFFVVQGLCQSLRYFTHVTNFLSIWYLICVQVDRYMAMWHISRRPENVPTKRAAFLALAIALFGFVSYSVVICTSGVGLITIDKKACIFYTEYFDTLRVFSQADAVIASMMPYIMLPMLNLLVLIQVCVRYASLRHASYKTNKHESAENISLPSSTDDDPHLQIQSSTSGSQNYLLRARSQVQSTTAFLVVTSIIWILNAPSQAIYIAEFLWFESKAMQVQQIKHLYIYKKIYNYLYIASFSMKWILYLIFSSSWRNVLKTQLDNCGIDSGSDDDMYFEEDEVVLQDEFIPNHCSEQPNEETVSQV